MFCILLHLLVGNMGVAAQGSQMANHFFSQLSEHSLNAMNSMNKLPSVMTMGKNCGMNTGITSRISSPALQNTGLPQPYMNPAGVNMSPAGVQSVYMGASSQCPCMMTVNSIGCPVCDCNQGQVQSNEAYFKETTIVNNQLRKTTSLGPTPSSQIFTKMPSSTSKRVDSKVTVGKHLRAPESNDTGLDKHEMQSHSIDNEKSPDTVSDESVTPTTFRQHENAVYNQTAVGQKMFQEGIWITKEKCFPVAVGLGTALLIVSIFAIVLFILWRTSSKELKHERNELYFAEKSIRQGSMISEIQNEILAQRRDSVYSNVQPVDLLPELPDRPKSPLTPTAPPCQTTPKKQCVFEFPQEENKHDYLELI